MIVIPHYLSHCSLNGPTWKLHQSRDGVLLISSRMRLRAQLSTILSSYIVFKVLRLVSLPALLPPRNR